MRKVNSDFDYRGFGLTVKDARKTREWENE